MKTTQLLLATALLAGIAGLAYAGPGPQFWNQQATLRAANAPAKASPVVPDAACCTGSCSCAALKKS